MYKADRNERKKDRRGEGGTPQERDGNTGVAEGRRRNREWRGTGDK